ncbi:golgi to ER traffic protein 1 [[Candida] anglica]|uniref:Golgi to ER traffic protein 1 n=1 Tax=[Candida] anglica TaxID=148631 RepID=A0ABP0EAK6_9ASCO
MLDLHPYTLLVVVFTVLCVKQFVSYVGKPKIQSFVWQGYTKYVAPKLGNSKLVEISKKRTQLKDVLRQRNAISAQDEYAKWTKLNRQHDKIEAEITEMSKSLGSEEAQVNKLVGYAITAIVTLPLWFFRVWFRKSVLFYLPPGALPYPVEWVLALPFVVTGGIGLTIWMFAVNNVLSSLIFLLTFPFEARVPKPELKTEVEKKKKN